MGGTWTRASLKAVEILRIVAPTPKESPRKQMLSQESPKGRSNPTCVILPLMINFKYQKPTKYHKQSFWCKHCMDDKKVKAYHPRVRCKSKFLKQTQALFHAWVGDSDDSEDEEDKVEESTDPLN